MALDITALQVLVVVVGYIEENILAVMGLADMALAAETASRKAMEPRIWQVMTSDRAVFTLVCLLPLRASADNYVCTVPAKEILYKNRPIKYNV
jgi:hypothetical protein